MRRKCFLLIALLGLWLLGGESVSAQVVVGQAPIISTVDEARAEAKKCAMRDVVEMEVGVKVSSKTESSMGMVVADEIVAKSDGYVVVNKIIREWQSEGFYFVELDLTANAQKIATAVEDLKGRLQAIAEEPSSSRSNIQVAVVEKDPQGKYSFSAGEIVPYILDRLKSVGFGATANDEVTEYILSHATDADVGLQARRIARESLDRGNALIRGVLSTEEVHKRGDGQYEASVKASFELVSLDNNAVDAFSRYFTAVGATESLAIQRAKDDATRAAMESLGKQAVETVQSETRGGSQQFKLAVVFSNVTDFAGQPQQILQALQNARCQVLRSARGANNTFRVAIVTDAYSNINDIQTAIMSQLPGLSLGEGDANALGSTKLYFSF